MPLFLCRWPNGDCSVVLARTRDDAVIELDQVGNADTLSPDGRTAIARAVEEERNRLDREQTPVEPLTARGRQLKTQADIPTVLIDRLVRKGATKHLRTFKGRGKPSRSVVAAGARRRGRPQTPHPRLARAANACSASLPGGDRAGRAATGDIKNGWSPEA